MTGPADDLERELQDVAWLRRLARSLVRDDATADDVVQEACVAAVRAGPPRARSLRAWLATVARNAALRKHRDERRRAAREAAAARPEACPGATETAEKLETARALLAAVEALDEPYRTAIRLRWLDGLPPHDVAARLGVSPEIAWKRLSRGLAMLRARLDRDRGGRGAWMLAVADLGGLRAVDAPWTTAQVVGLAARGLAAAALTLALLLGGAFAPEAVSPETTSADVATGRGAWAPAGWRDGALAPAGSGGTAAQRAGPRARAARPTQGGPSDVESDVESDAAVGHDVAKVGPPPAPASQDRVSGRVVGPDGRPVAGAIVTSLAPYVWSVRTDDAGRFVLASSLPPRTTRIGATAPGCGLRIVEVPATSDRSANVGDMNLGPVDIGDVVLGPAAPIAGVVVDDAGAPVENAGVGIRDPAGVRVPSGLWTGADGAFRYVESSPGDWTITVCGPAPDEDWLGRVERRVRGGDESVRIVLPRRPPGRATVLLEVVADDGRAADVRAAVLQARPPLGGLRLAPLKLVAGDDGILAARGVRPGSWTAWVHPRAGAPAVLDVEVGADDLVVRRRLVASPPGRATFRSATSEDLPERAFIVVSPPGFSMPVVGHGVPAGPNPPRAGGVAQRCDDGSFRLEGLAPGTYRAVLFARGWAAPVIDVEIRSGEETCIDVAVRRGVALHWAPRIARGQSADVAISFPGSTSDFTQRLVGFGEPGWLELPSSPAGRIRWTVRVVGSETTPDGSAATTSFDGTVEGVEGSSIVLPEGPFAAPR